ncbi:hypothetical protein L484_007912 [Morus notabilis]|uniref:DOG1 domain-containing protein n=1 Tax=Morus notabilis TaxID=981085 RepID=W9R0J4_9ROSA|nr:protein DOG1-like 4 [Morus notabilis]EXB53541.1 hypothetical protein L484_007912 [Morus notabilis]
MSLASSSATCLSSAIRNNSPEHESFQKFFECWLSGQNQHLQELISAAKSPASAADEAALRSLIERVVKHYECYYRAKATWSRRDVLAMLTPSWRSTLEDAFLWIGGWRPSMAFHLLYSKSGLQLEAPGRLSELINAMTTTTATATAIREDLADISPEQLSRVDGLQRRTIKEEKEISEEMAKRQETLAAPDIVELSHVVSEQMTAGGGGSRDGDEEEEEERVETALKPKEKGLEEVLERADELRLRTLKDVIHLLTPIQAVHFLIAAAELHLRIHEWGKKRDAKTHQQRHLD